MWWWVVWRWGGVGLGWSAGGVSRCRFGRIGWRYDFRLIDDIDLHAAVVLQAGNEFFAFQLFRAFGDRLFFTDPARMGNAGVGVTAGDEIITHCLGTLFRKLVVVAIAADAIGGADHMGFFNILGGFQSFGERIKLRFRFIGQGVLC